MGHLRHHAPIVLVQQPTEKINSQVENISQKYTLDIIHFGKIYFQKIHFGKNLGGEYTLRKYTLGKYTSGKYASGKDTFGKY